MKNPEVFEGKHFQDILKEIHTHTTDKRESIKTLMDTLAGLIKKPQDAAVVVPAVRDLLEVSVKNDEHLIKIATIIQRLMTAEGSSMGGSSIEQLLSEEEKQVLLGEAKKVQEEAGKEALDELNTALEEDVDDQELEERTRKTINRIKKSK